MHAGKLQDQDPSKLCPSDLRSLPPGSLGNQPQKAHLGEKKLAACDSIPQGAMWESRLSQDSGEALRASTQDSALSGSPVETYPQDMSFGQE